MLNTVYIYDSFVKTEVQIKSRFQFSPVGEKPPKPLTKPKGKTIQCLVFACEQVGLSRYESGLRVQIDHKNNRRCAQLSGPLLF